MATHPGLLPYSWLPRLIQIGLKPPAEPSLLVTLCHQSSWLGSADPSFPPYKSPCNNKNYLVNRARADLKVLCLGPPACSLALLCSTSWLLNLACALTSLRLISQFTDWDPAFGLLASCPSLSSGSAHPFWLWSSLWLPSGPRSGLSHSHVTISWSFSVLFFLSLFSSLWTLKAKKLLSVNINLRKWLHSLGLYLQVNVICSFVLSIFFPLHHIFIRVVFRTVRSIFPSQYFSVTFTPN